MSRYFFDIRDGDYIPEKVGCEFADLDAARLHAVVKSGEILMANPSRFWDGEEWQLEVRDRDRRLLFALTFMATESPNLPPRQLRTSSY
jgi:hypothetical protein